MQCGFSVLNCVDFLDESEESNIEYGDAIAKMTRIEYKFTIGSC